jgi:hypothetical protein
MKLETQNGEEGITIRRVFHVAPRPWAAVEREKVFDVTDRRETVLAGLPGELVGAVLAARQAVIDAWMEWAEGQLALKTSTLRIPAELDDATAESLLIAYARDRA